MESSVLDIRDGDSQRSHFDPIEIQQIDAGIDLKDKRTSATSLSMYSVSRTEICQCYLNFDTQLPAAILPSAPTEDDRPDIPSAPDLSQYICPLLWSPQRKNVLLVLSCVATFLTAYSAGSYSPPSRKMADDLGTSHLAVLVGITTFCIGFAFAPMMMAPISEIWGRRPVFLVFGIIYVVFQLVCSFVSDLAGMLICRFLVGIGGSVFSSVVGGVIADLWDKSERNTPMALFSGAVLAGTGAGPLVASAMIDNMHNSTKAWKWTFWHQVIMDTILVVAFFVLFGETRGSVVLRSKAQRLNEWYNQLEEHGVYEFRILDATAWADEQQKLCPATELQAKCLADVVRRPRWVIREDEQRTSLAVSLAFHRTCRVLFLTVGSVRMGSALSFLCCCSFPLLGRFQQV
jgi:MFS family permease